MSFKKGSLNLSVAESRFITNTSDTGVGKPNIQKDKQARCQIATSRDSKHGIPTDYQ